MTCQEEDIVLTINSSQKDLHQYYLIKNYLNIVKSPLRLNENNTSSSHIIVGFEYSGEKFQQQTLFMLKWEESACHCFGRSKIYPDLGPKQAPQQSPHHFICSSSTINLYDGHLNY